MIGRSWIFFGDDSCRRGTLVQQHLQDYKDHPPSPSLSPPHHLQDQKQQGLAHPPYSQACDRVGLGKGCRAGACLGKGLHDEVSLGMKWCSGVHCFGLEHVQEDWGCLVKGYQCFVQRQSQRHCLLRE